VQPDVLYPTLEDVPGLDRIYRATTGQQQPAATALAGASLSQP
jgi:hypothetical protein